MWSKNYTSGVGGAFIREVPYGYGIAKVYTAPALPYLPLQGAGVPVSLHDETWLIAARMN